MKKEALLRKKMKKQKKDDDVERNADEDREDTDRKAKEDKGLLSRLSSRIGVGGEVAKKVGRRGFERPNVAISNRIYEQYDVPDPWAPKSKKKSNKWETRLGVSLKLGEAKRQPGRHLMPKEPKRKRLQRSRPIRLNPLSPKAYHKHRKQKPNHHLLLLPNPKELAPLVDPKNMVLLVKFQYDPICKIRNLNRGVHHLQQVLVRLKTDLL